MNRTSGYKWIGNIADCKRQWFFDECFMLFSCNRMSNLNCLRIWIVSFRFVFLYGSLSLSTTIETLQRFLYCQRNICLVPYRFRYSTSPFETKHYFILLAGIRQKPFVEQANWLLWPIGVCRAHIHTHSHTDTQFYPHIYIYWQTKSSVWVLNQRINIFRFSNWFIITLHVWL